MSRAATLALATLTLGVAVALAQIPSPQPAEGFGAAAGAPHLAAEAFARPAAADPFPLRRVLATADRLPALLKLLPPGPVVTLDRDEFEAQARVAAGAKPTAIARLLEARYAATHSADGLRGTLTWRFPAGPAEFPLTASGVAFGPDAAGRVVADATRGPLLRLPDGGDVALVWSARATSEGDAERFELVLPPAPLATLDLDLPADREPTLTAGDAARSLSGPLPGAAAGRQLRRVLFPGVGRVEFALRPVAGPAERGAPVKASRVARFDFAPGVVNFAFDCALEAARGAPEELTFLVDPRCHVTEVAASGGVAWSVEGTPPRLRVRCPAGLPSKLTVAGFAALPPSAEAGWPLPDLRLVDGLPGGDAVEVTCRPDVQWLGCDPGDYRSHSLPPPAAADDGVRFGFLAVPSETAANPGASRRLPSVRVKSLGATYSTGDDVTWEAGTPAEESRLTARFRVAVSRGPLESLTLQHGPGYRVVSAELAAEDAPLVVKDRRVELTRPARAGESVEVVVKLAGPRPRPGVAVPFPQVSCSNAVGREGTYTVVAPPGYDAAATAPPSSKTAHPTRLRYPIRGRGPNAALTLTPHETRLSGASDTVMTLVEGRPCRVTVFRLNAGGGPLGEVRLRVPRGDGGFVRPEGLVARVASASPVEPWGPTLGATNPLAALALAASAATGDRAMEVQRVTFPPDAAEGVVRVRAFADRDGNFPDALPAVIGAAVVPASPGVPDPPPGEAGPPPWRFRGLRRDVAVDAGGVVTVAVGGSVVGGASAEWRVELPADAELLGVTAYGKSAAGVRLDGGAAVLPPRLATGGAAPPEMPFEVRFRLPGRVPVTGGTVDVPAVGLPGDPPLPTAWEAAAEYRAWPRLDALTDATDRDGPLTLVPLALPVALGWAAAALLLGAAFTLAVRRRLSPGLLLGVGVGGLFAAATLPPGWSLVLRPFALALVLLVTIALLAPRLPRRGVLALTLGVAGVAGAAGTADPQTVLVVAGPGERWAVYAARSTLDAFGRLSLPTPPGFALTGVEYVGRGGPTGAAQFTLTVALAAAGDGPEVYELPLGGVRLDSMELDGKPALPEATRPDAYAVGVRGRGPHTLVARFRVPTVAADGGREARFTGPDFPAARVAFRTSAANVAVVSRRGAQSVERRDGETVATADHGGGRAVAVRTWDAPAAATPVASVREGHLWDIGEADATLRSAFQWTVSSGSLDSVAVEVPADLEPGTPTVRSAGPRPGGAAEVCAVTLTPAGAGRKLVAHFAAPLAGKFTLLVAFTPRTPLVARPVLTLPRALTAAASETLVGLRVRGLTLDALEKRGLIDFPADDLTRRFGAPPEWQLDRAPADRVLQRLPGPAAELRPTLRPKPDAGVVACETRWTLGPAVEVEAQVAVTKFAPTDAVEIDWPDGAVLREVRSPELHGWSKSGSRVQVWFRRPTRQAVVTLIGTSPAAPPVAGTTLDLGAVRAAGVLGVSVLRVRPASGLEARWVPAKGVALRPDSTPAETLLTLDAGVSAGRVRVEPLPATEPARPKPPPRATTPAPPVAAVTAEALVVDSPPADDWAAARAWMVALSTPSGLLAVALARRRGLRAPECLAACGLLGAGVAGPATFLGLIFVVAVVAGLAWRLARLSRRASRLVLR